MKRLLSIVAVLVLSLGLTAGVSAPAQAAVDLTAPFSREPVKRGDVDKDQWNIEHVYEVQYRLRWLKFLDATPNGVFGPQTELAVKRFQRSQGLPITGVVNASTWKPLIQKTVRGRGAVPDRCKNGGWHTCYDRWRHQLNLYLNGTLVNSWLVRGGASDSPTRVGNFEVQWRDEDHTSSQFGGAPMPYSQFFSGGQALHGSRNMMDPYVGHSHGCVNLWVEDARQLWNLTHDKRLFVHVYGAWD
ncbi:MAG: L,D-transpeptidase family protein [Nocardioidaceae bacterium]